MELSEMVSREAIYNNKLDGWLGWGFGVGIGLSFVFSGLVVLYQSVNWLKNGYWIPMPFSKVLDSLGVKYSTTFKSSWSGLNKLMGWVLSGSLEMHMGMSAVILTFISLLFLGSVIETLFKKRSISYHNRL